MAIWGVNILIYVPLCFSVRKISGVEINRSETGNLVNLKIKINTIREIDWGIKPLRNQWWSSSVIHQTYTNRNKEWNKASYGATLRLAFQSLAIKQSLIFPFPSSQKDLRSRRQKRYIWRDDWRNEERFGIGINLLWWIMYEAESLKAKIII